MKHRSTTFLATVVPPALALIIVLAPVEGWARWSHEPTYLIPRPSAIFLALGSRGATLWNALLWTAVASLAGFAASTIFGILAAILLAGSKWVRRAVYPYTLFFQTVPIVAIAPLLVFWMGVGIVPVATCAFVVSVFPVIANTLSGLVSTEPALVDLFRLYGASRFASLWKLRLPAALPNIFIGLRIAAGLAVIGAVVAEFLVGTLGEHEGLGVRIVENIKYAYPDRVFAAVLLASFLGLAMFTIINIIAYLSLRRWHASQ